MRFNAEEGFQTLFTTYFCPSAAESDAGFGFEAVRLAPSELGIAACKGGSGIFSVEHQAEIRTQPAAVCDTEFHPVYIHKGEFEFTVRRAE